MSRDFPGRHWFLIALILLIPVGMLAPGFGIAIKQNGWTVPLFVGIMLGIAGFTMDTSQLVKQSVNLRAIVPVLFCTYILAPSAAYGLGRLFAPHGDVNFITAMMIMAAQAGSLASAIALTMMAGGNRELALVCTLLSNCLTVFLTPFILRVSIGANVEFQVSEMISRMGMVVLFPIFIGQLLRKFIWGKTESIRPLIKMVPQFIVLLFVYTGFASGAGQLMKDGTLVIRFLGACILLHLLLLSFMTLISGLLRLEWPERTAVILCGSQKTLPNGIYVWNNFFQANPYGAVPLVLYHLFQLVVDTLLVPKCKKRNPDLDDSANGADMAPAGCHGSVKQK